MLANGLLKWPVLFAIITILMAMPFFSDAKNVGLVDAKFVEAETVKVGVKATTDISTTTLLQALKLSAGTGSFIQNKHFKFLSIPIRSTGAFIVEQQAVLWQTQLPVFSEILIQAEGIYQRLDA